MDKSPADQKKRAKRKIRRYLVTPELMPMTFEQGNVIEIENGIPFGAQFCGFSHDASRNLINLFVEHESFDEIEDGAVVPEFQLKIKRRK